MAFSVSGFAGDARFGTGTCDLTVLNRSYSLVFGWDDLPPELLCPFSETWTENCPDETTWRAFIHYTVPMVGPPLWRLWFQASDVDIVGYAYVGTFDCFGPNEFVLFSVLGDGTWPPTITVFPAGPCTEEEP